MSAKDIKRKCSSCGGSGKCQGVDPAPPHNPIEVDCRRCVGTGELDSGYLSDDIITLLNDIMDKCNDILEKLNE